MGTDTTAKQNTVIWSATGGLVILLFAIIGYLWSGRDMRDKEKFDLIMVKLGEVQIVNAAAIIKTDAADAKILEGLNKVCDRLGTVEGRVSNLEIFIQMPYKERALLLERYPTGPDWKSKVK